MPEWVCERGIGETRFALLDRDEIVQARIDVDSVANAGSIHSARLVSSGIRGRNAIARADDGSQYLLPQSPSVPEGRSLTIEVTRERIPGSEPWKRAIARAMDKGASSSSPMGEPSARDLPFPGATDELGTAGWADLMDEARDGLVRFAGGELRIALTPAMTLIDVDGHLEPEDLAVAGAREAARAIRRLDIGGSIGIDLPTVSGKAARKAAGQAIDAVLPQPFERTAVNGFGFIQIVRPRRRASLIELAQDSPAFEARALLRRLAFEPGGARCLVAHPSVVDLLKGKPQWIEVLARQLGGTIRLRAEAKLPMSGGYAENC